MWRNDSDLHYLDMQTMVWQVVPRDDSNVWPESRVFHTMTTTSSNAAMLIGGMTEKEKMYSRADKNCWRLNIEACLSKGKARDVWTRCEHLERKGGWELHRAVQDPRSHRLWLIGGYAQEKKSDIHCSDHVKELTVRAPPLKVLAVESVARNVHLLAAEIEEFPRKDALRLAVETEVKKYEGAEN